MSALVLMTLLLGAEPACSRDDDCVLVTPCSCACCPEAPRAVTKAEAARVLNECAKAADCPIRSCPEVECRAGDASVGAACRDHLCVEVKPTVPGRCVGCPPGEACRDGGCTDTKTPAQPSACVTDADCTMAHDCGCGCCPSPSVPMTKQSALALRQKCARLGPCGRDPKQCAGATCVPDVPGTAVCQESVCVRAPRQRPVLDAGVR